MNVTEDSRHKNSYKEYFVLFSIINGYEGDSKCTVSKNVDYDQRKAYQVIVHVDGNHKLAIALITIYNTEQHKVFLVGIFMARILCHVHRH